MKRNNKLEFYSIKKEHYDLYCYSIYIILNLIECYFIVFFSPACVSVCTFFVFCCCG